MACSAELYNGKHEKAGLHRLHCDLNSYYPQIKDDAKEKTISKRAQIIDAHLLFRSTPFGHCENTSVVPPLSLLPVRGLEALVFMCTAYFHLNPSNRCWDTAALCLRHSSNQSSKTVLTNIV